MVKHNFYPFNSDKLVYEKDNKAIIKVNLLDKDKDVPNFLEYLKKGHLCGYVALKKGQVPEEWLGNYSADALQYLSIHGGITFCEIYEDYVVFGLDCAHAGDEEREELRDPMYVMGLVEDMEQQLLEYTKVIKKWRRSSREKRIKMIDKIRNKSKYFKGLGFGAMIDMLGGSKDFDKKNEISVYSCKNCTKCGTEFKKEDQKFPYPEKEVLCKSCFHISIKEGIKNLNKVIKEEQLKKKMNNEKKNN